MMDPRHEAYRDRITDEAAEWFARLQDTDVTAADRDAFTEWLSASPKHVEEYLSLTTLYSDISELPETYDVAQLVQRASMSQENVIEGPFRALAGRAGRRVRHGDGAQGRRLGPRAWLAFAASLTLLTLAGIWVWRSDPNSAVYTTGIGEQKSFPLSDGSLVTLNAVSQLKVRYAEQHRDIELISGEALFSVAKNPQRPFRVLTRDSVIKAVGTQFNVHHRKIDTTVTVVDGTVEVEKNAQEGLRPETQKSAREHRVRITQGQRARVTKQAKTIRVSATNVAADTAWRERRLIFESRPLAAVVEEFNLYNEAPIEISDSALQGILISGSFFANDPRSFALFLEEANLARVDVQPDRIRLALASRSQAALLTD